MSIEINELRPADHDEVITLWRKVVSAGTSGADIEALLSATRNHPLRLSVVARTEGQLIGAALSDWGPAGLAFRLLVAPEQRQEELVRQLVDRAMLKLTQAGGKKCHIQLPGGSEEPAFWDSVLWSQQDPTPLAEADPATDWSFQRLSEQDAALAAGAA